MRTVSIVRGGKMKKCGCVYQRASVVGARERNSNCIAVNKRLKRQRTFGMRNSETVLTTVRNHRLSKAKELRIKRPSTVATSSVEDAVTRNSKEVLLIE